MAGLYIHIPFCSSRCIYCGFYSTTALELRQKYVDALCREMEMRNATAQSSTERGCIDTVYLGGGTPSQLTPSQLEQLFIYINKVYAPPLFLEGDDEKQPEVTIECNPDDITADFAEALSQLPVNRVSMGAQTFDDSRLQFLRRRHTAAQVPQSVERLRNAGIRNISVDLMYGFPGETLEDWNRDVDEALRLGVEHLSSYCLTIEEGTALYRLMKAESTDLHVDEELERAMYELLIDRLTAAGYEHYEISNFAKSGRRSRHNSSYWTGVPYIGLGAAAHSYNISSRRWNIADISRYIAGIENGKPEYEQELIDEDTRYNDTVTVALRTCEGIDLQTLTAKHREYCLKNARRYLDNQLMELKEDHLRLTRRGLFVSNMVMSDLIWI